MLCRSNTLMRLLTNLSLFVFIGAASVVAEEVTEMSLGTVSYTHLTLPTILLV